MIYFLYLCPRIDEYYSDSIISESFSKTVGLADEPFVACLLNHIQDIGNYELTLHHLILKCVVTALQSVLLNQQPLLASPALLQLLFELLHLQPVLDRSGAGDLLVGFVFSLIESLFELSHLFSQLDIF